MVQQSFTWSRCFSASEAALTAAPAAAVLPPLQQGTARQLHAPPFEALAHAPPQMQLLLLQHQPHPAAAALHSNIDGNARMNFLPGMNKWKEPEFSCMQQQDQTSTSALYKHWPDSRRVIGLQ
jgi:hypothetical protein